MDWIIKKMIHISNQSKTLFDVFSKYFFQLFIISSLLIIQSCVPDSGSKKSTKKSNTTTDTTNTANPTLPNFSSNTNFIQNGKDIYNSTAIVNLPFSDTLYLRGKQIDAFIRTNLAANSQLCAVFRVLDSSVNKAIIINLRAQNFYNLSTNVREYYYAFNLNDEENNKSFCQKTGLINKLSTLYPTLSGLNYQIKNMCSSTCSKTEYSTLNLEPFSPSGSNVTALTLSNLQFKLTNYPQNDSSTPLTCTANDSCKAQGYSCCSLGQCVRDLEVKGSVDQSSPAFINVMNEILANPNNIYNYPNYFHICAQIVNPTPDNSTPIDPTTEARLRIENLGNLYNCINKVEGEMGLCTVEYDGPKKFDPAKTIDENEALGQGVYYTSVDDRSFKATFTNLNVDKLPNFTIEKISYGGKILFLAETNRPTPTASSSNSTELRNNFVVINPTPSSYDVAQSLPAQTDDSLTTATKVILKNLPADSEVAHKKLLITYRTDSSCIALNSSLAKCEKHYIQGQKSIAPTFLQGSRLPVTDHYANSLEAQDYKLPLYADTQKIITVSLDGQTLVRDTDWQLVVQIPQSYIKLLGLKSATTGQKIKINYYVDRSLHTNVGLSKFNALTKIQDMCKCQGNDCNLKPVTNTAGTVVDYICIYPNPVTTDPPLNQKVYLSAKSVPVRFFESSSGLYVAEPKTGNVQEGEKFEYTNGDLKKPNNLNNYIGFNEIYGTIGTSASSAKAPKEVNVKKGKTYDIYADQGSFSSCLQCGNDYYSQLNRIFPYSQFAGGTKPLKAMTSRTSGDSIRSDDFLFGRACFVPATMIPWSHRPSISLDDQRKNRQALQHFYFANGYQRDWYGFDYGSVIGSFDGVKWFSIGSKRRIKAETNKLFIAVNGYFGDQTVDTTFNITVLDSTINQYGDTLPTKDIDSDGAECQRYHQCSSDNDCTATLGYEYACSSVNELSSLWPIFDANANEITDASNEDSKLVNIFSSNVGSAKRCVYRGKGAMCTPNYASMGTNGSTYFNGNVMPALHMCSSNSSCQTLQTPGGNLVNGFNTKISRYAKTMRETFSDGSEDWFGLGAKILGRPLNYRGVDAYPTNLAGNINSNKIKALCVPGRNPSGNTFEEQNLAANLTNTYQGDRVLGIGQSIQSSENQNSVYLNSCSVTDSTGNFFAITNPGVNQYSTPEIGNFAATQNISSNALKLLKNAMSAKNISFTTFIPSNDKLQSFALLENSCLRAPGASCFSDQECAPSKAIADKIKLLPADSTVLSFLNPYELKFWQEELICSQKETNTSTLYDPKNNRCCRDIGKTISIGHQNESNGLDYSNVPAIDTSLASVNRYSRVSTIYQKIKDASLPKICHADNSYNAAYSCSQVSNMNGQYKTIDYIGQKTSCTESWVRPFANGSRAWNANQHQKFAASLFRCLNWLPHIAADGDLPFSCAGKEIDDPTCKLIQTTPASYKALGVMEYLERLELLGIPQIYLDRKETFTALTEGTLSCRLDSSNIINIAYPAAGHKSIDIFSTTVTQDTQYSNGTTEFYAGNKNTYFKNLKQVFKTDEIVSCLPAGTQVAVGADPNRCCTGFINGQTNRCQLDDYADVSVYTNRYVSSEARGIADNQFKSESGYIKNLSTIHELACLKSMCASGVMAKGVLVSLLKIPGQENEEALRYRFLENSINADNATGLLDLYNMGLKLNNHLYCIPAALADQEAEGLEIYSCGE